MKLQLTALLLVFSSIATANTVRIGNGGGTSYDRNASLTDISAALMTTSQELKLVIHAWIQTQNNTLILKPNQFQALEDAINNTPVEIQKTPCMVNGKEYLAAAYSKPKTTICVNAAGLTSVLTVYNYRHQLLALFAHEYSHLLGFNEDQAIAFQNDVLLYMDMNGYPDLPTFPLIGFGPTKSLLILDWTNRPLVQSQYSIVMQTLEKQIESLYSLQKTTYPILPESENVFADALLRVRYIGMLVKANWTNTPESILARTNYNSLFADSMSENLRAKVTAKDIALKLGILYNYSAPKYPDAEFRYIDPPKVTAQEMANLLVDLEKSILELNTNLNNALF
ncbi:hypothetical protein [Bdellovibrio sp. HCB209]|uniref:hypothetical protein n=1 Tax=Bdellovibrio sp. HCB209 TaxID=3394354 RepID=UPI0039B384AE